MLWPFDSVVSSGDASQVQAELSTTFEAYVRRNAGGKPQVLLASGCLVAHGAKRLTPPGASEDRSQHNTLSEKNFAFRSLMSWNSGR